MILNVGCGGRECDRASYFGDVRIDVKRFPSVTILMDAHFLAFRDSTFDRIVCFEVLEHLDSLFNALKEFRRVLKDDGDVIVSVPNVWYWRRILRFFMKRHEIFDEIPSTGHKQAWDVFEFSSLAYHAGFKVVNVRFLNWYPRGKHKLKILEPLLKVIPQIKFSHVMFKLKPR